MRTTTTVIISHLNCPYTVRIPGDDKPTNLAQLRRAQLQRLGQSLGIVGDMSKNDLLTQLMARLQAMGAESDLGALAI